MKTPAERFEIQGEGRQRVAHLLGEDHRLDRAEALAAVLLGKRDAGPSELADLAPQTVVVGAVGLGELADLLGRKTRGEKLAGGRLDLALLVVEVEVHEKPSLARGANLVSRLKALTRIT